MLGHTDSPVAHERTARPSIFSYGPHFPMAIQSENPDVWYVNMARYGPTTSAHQRGVREALVQAGFTVNAEHPEVIRDNQGRLFARYARR